MTYKVYLIVAMNMCHMNKLWLLSVVVVLTQCQSEFNTGEGAEEIQTAESAKPVR